MTNDENKAIELIKQYKNEIKNKDIKSVFILDTALNIINKLKKENEEKDKYIKDSENITEEMKNDVNKLLLEIRQKDKQIDLMAEYIEKVTVDMKIAFGENMLWDRNQIKQDFEQLAKEKGE